MIESIINILLSSSVNRLQEVLIDEVPDGRTQVGLIREGKLQADPRIAKLNILLHNGGEEFKHQRAPDYHYAIRELGSARAFGERPTEFWLRRYRAEIKFFFIGTIDRESSIESANLILSRAEHGILTMPMPSSSDPYEHAVMVDVIDSFLDESGGPGNFQHRGELRFEFLTERIR